MKARLNYARDMLALAMEAMAEADRLHAASREMGGGIPGFGGSGSQRAASQVRSAADRAQRAWREAQERIDLWTHKVRSLERRIAEAERVRYTATDLKGAALIKAGGSWRQVVRVSAKSVTVATPYSWTDRIPIDQVTDFRRTPGTAS